MFLEMERKKRYASLRDEFVADLKERFEREDTKASTVRNKFFDTGGKKSKGGFFGN